MSYIKDDVSAKRKVGMILTYAVLILFAILAIAPLLWLAINSFKTSQDYQMNRLGLPKRFFWQNYTQAWQRGHFGIFIVNSIIYTSITTVSILILSFMSGFAFAKISNRNTKWIYGSYVVGILMTLQSIMIPLFIVINQVGLYDTKLGVLIPYVGIGLPMGIYLATEFMKSIPNALVESARLDGAHYFRIFRSIMVPMAAPVGTTIAILQISGTWNEFMLINMLTSSQKNKSLPVGIQSFAGSLSTDYGKLFASLMIGLIPMLIFYIVFRKEITKGVSAGAVKG
ncbi:MAG: carbohydrate ABC transporter permease [Spirochaetales bacterium]|nr:carbohydrate ABC transporter permease [Spirochaetales bacterium]